MEDLLSLNTLMILKESEKLKFIIKLPYKNIIKLKSPTMIPINSL